MRRRARSGEAEGGLAMWKEALVDGEHCPLVVDKKVKDVALIPAREVVELDLVLRQLRQADQTLLELFCLH